MGTPTSRPTGARRGSSEAIDVRAEVERYRNSPVMHPTTPEASYVSVVHRFCKEYKPMIFADGQRVQFPGPTKAIRAPKLKYVAPAHLNDRLERLARCPTLRMANENLRLPGLLSSSLVDGSRVG